MSNPYVLTELSRREWLDWLKDGLLRAGSTQGNVAANIFGLRDSGKPRNTTEVNRFCQGDPEILRKWFDLFPERIADAAVEMNRTPEELRNKLDSLLAGVAPTVLWHPAFPGVPEEDALIPAPLEAFRGSEPGAVARDFVNRVLPAAAQWKEETVFSSPLELVAEPGASRRIALQQLRNAIEVELRAKVAEARERSNPRGTQVRIPDVSVVIAREGQEPQPLQVRVVGKTPPSDRAWFAAPLRLGAWSPAQAVALARRLSASKAVAGTARAVLATFAKSLEQHPGWSATVLEPDLVIRWLAEAARSGAPDSASGARALLTAAAWRRCREAVRGGPLEQFDEALLDDFFALMARRSRGCDELGPWTRLPREAANRLLARALGTTLDGVHRDQILKLVDDLSKPGRGRDKRMARLRQAVAGARPRDVLQALIDGGVLRASRGDTVEATEPELAAAHAARGLRSVRVLGDHPELLVDPNGGWLIDELARHGSRWSEFLRATGQAPDELAADVALARVRFAWCSDTPVSSKHLIPAWANLLWSAAHGLFEREPVGWMERWTREVQSLLKAVSWRFRGVLPLLGREPVRDLEKLVDPEVRELVARWRLSPGPADVSAPPDTLSALGFGVVGFRNHEELENQVRALAPAQLHPVRSWSHWRWRSLPLSASDRLNELACAGDEDARDALTGRAWLRERPEFEAVRYDLPRRDLSERFPATDVWHRTPLGVRLAWALRDGPRGEDGWTIYLSLVRELHPMRHPGREPGPALDKQHPLFDGVVELGALQPPEEVAAVVGQTLQPGRPGFTGWFPVEVAWALAERFKLESLLEELVVWPASVAPALVFEVHDHGPRLSWGNPDCYEPLKPRWSPVGRPRDGSPSKYRYADLEVDAVVARWRECAHRAAVMLAKLGRAEFLLAAWQGAGVVLAPQPVRQQASAYAFALQAVEGADLWLRRKAPLDLLADLAPPGESESRGRRVFWHHRGSQLGVQGMNAWDLVSDPWIRDEVRQAARGLIALLEMSPLAWPEPVRQWALMVKGGGLLGVPDGRGAVVAHQLRSTAAALLELGHMAPLELWVTGEHLRHGGVAGGGPNRQAAALHANATAVEEWWKQDRVRLDQLWKLLAEVEPEIDAVAADALRRELLLEGSHRLGWRDDAPTAAECPRPFVVQAAIDDVEALVHVGGRNRTNGRWASVLRHHYSRAGDRRSAAWYAARIEALEPGCAELTRELRYWLLEDPTPWAGPLDWERTVTGDGWRGGTSELLDLALARDEDWSTQGLSRLWLDGLDRPWLGFSGHAEPEAASGWWYTAGTSPPDVVRKLAGTLVGRGRGELVLAAWPPPPSDDERGASGEAVERTRRLREWLEPTVTKLAPASMLRERVRAWTTGEGASLLPLAEVWELFDRGDSGFEEAAVLMGTDLLVPRLTMLARWSPERLLDVVRARAARGDDPRYLAWLLAAECSVEGSEVPAAVLEARRLFLQHTEPDDPSQVEGVEDGPGDDSRAEEN